MFFETIFFGAFIALSSAVLFGCSKKDKKMAPTVTPRAAAKPAATPPSPSPSKEKDPEKEEKKKEEVEKKDDEKQDEKKKEEEKEDEDKKKASEEKDEEKEKKKASDEKDDADDEKKKEKKASDENGDKKEEEKNDEEKKDPKKEEKNEAVPGKKTLVSADPMELQFDVSKTTQKNLKLTNLTEKTIMFKIKSSTTSAFLINPVFGKINPKGSFEVTLTHKPSAKREDKLVIVTSEMIGKEIDMQKTFKALKTTGADVTVKLVAA